MFGTFLQIETLLQDSIVAGELQESIYQVLKTKFIEGNPYFMSVITFILVLGVAFCIERIIYLYLAQINAKKLLNEIEKHLNEGKLDEAKQTAKNTRGPIASICYQALERSEEDIDVIDKSITAYGSVQVSLLEKNLPWITLFIAAAPALGFLGTVMGMIEAFEKIQAFGDINPSIVAGGMKFALITTVGGLIVALILQFFYNFILTRIEKIVRQMETASISLLDLLIRYKKR
ncbi:MAG: MotA/TolQ/ExbB proton channel family protein [Candidatus Symbiothrix sp.]|jgi:biopolymer transport protein ExbB|nr:MotA/TolQ/ExbB proton channel family protein [Candidatus Symbiothrix sp.]